MKSKSVGSRKKLYEHEESLIVIFTQEDIDEAKNYPFRKYFAEKLLLEITKFMEWNCYYFMTFLFFNGKATRLMHNSQILHLSALDEGVKGLADRIYWQWKLNNPSDDDSEFDKHLAAEVLTGGVCVYTATSNDWDQLESLYFNLNMPTMATARKTVKHMRTAA